MVKDEDPWWFTFFRVFQPFKSAVLQEMLDSASWVWCWGVTLPVPKNSKKHGFPFQLRSWPTRIGWRKPNPQYLLTKTWFSSKLPRPETVWGVSTASDPLKKSTEADSFSRRCPSPYTSARSFGCWVSGGAWVETKPSTRGERLGDHSKPHKIS